MSQLRTPVLSDLTDKNYLWRSDWSNVLYRFKQGWQMYFDGRWEDCHNENGSARYSLYGSCGERFIRVGELR